MVQDHSATKGGLAEAAAWGSDSEDGNFPDNSRRAVQDLRTETEPLSAAPATSESLDANKRVESGSRLSAFQFHRKSWESADDNNNNDDDDDDDDDANDGRRVGGYKSKLKPESASGLEESGHADEASVSDPDEESYVAPSAQSENPVYRGYASFSMTFTETDFEPPRAEALAVTGAAFDAMTAPRSVPSSFPPPGCTPFYEFGNPQTKLAAGMTAFLEVNDTPLVQGQFVPFGILGELSELAVEVENKQASLDETTEALSLAQTKIDEYRRELLVADVGHYLKIFFLCEDIDQLQEQREMAKLLISQNEKKKKDLFEVLKLDSFADGAWHQRENCPGFGPSETTKEHCPLCFCAG
jgi:hypothetical protein